MRAPLISLVAGSLAALAACADPATAPVTRSALTPLGSVTSVTEPVSGPWARIVEGETGPGSLYAIYIPHDWNGEAIFFVHGIRAPFEPITLRDQDTFFQVRDALGADRDPSSNADRYAFVYSSFSENGLAIKDGAQRTHQLRGLLASEIGRQPARSYLAGYSLGAAVAVNLAERFPTQYDGVLAMCGMVGGTPRELEYVGDVRVLFDFFYPHNQLPGNVISVPTTPVTPQQVQAWVVDAISKSPTGPLGLFAIASIAQTPLAFAPVGSVLDPSSTAFQSLVGSLVTALFYQLAGTNDVVNRTHGHSPYANRDRVYTLGTPVTGVAPFVDMIRAAVASTNGENGVERFDTTPDAENYLEKYFVPTGNLQVPVVSVHNLWDPLVPFFHESAFAKIVADAGASNLLWQQAVPNYGHCNFPTPLVLSSFDKLVSWVTTGQRPGN